MYYDGKGVPQDYAEAATWFRQAADQGDAGAQSALGHMYYDGEGVPQDYAEATMWFRQAADQDYAGAQSFLGLMYYDGKGVPQDYAEAATWCRRAADQGDAPAQNLLGDMHYSGEGVPQNYDEAAMWYRQAADQGNADAQASLGHMYYYGEGVPQDYAEAATWLRPAADQGNSPSQNLLGDMHYSGEGVPQNYVEAAMWYRQAADQGNADAQGSLGYMYYKGQGVAQDYAEAATWYRRAAEAATWYRRTAEPEYAVPAPQTADPAADSAPVVLDQERVEAEAATRYRRAADQGDDLAPDLLGDMYYYGEGVPQNYVEAATWYRQAADQGDPDAQASLGYMYYKGQGVAQDYAEAAMWCRRAADQGNDFAQGILGDMYYYGEGAPQDYAEVTPRYRRATDQGDADELGEWAEQRMAAGGLAPVAELIERLEGAPPEKIGKRQLTKAADALARLSVGMAPDPRFDLHSPKLGEPVMLFPLPAGITRTEEVSAHYPPALLSLVMGTFVAHADGAVSDLERRHLINVFRSSSVLTDSEKARLQANLDWMMAVPPGLAPIRRRVKDMGDEVRHGLGRLALAVVGADGAVDPAEVKAVEKLYRILGIEADDVYRDLHALAAADEPVTVFRPTSAEPEFAVPAPEAASAADRAPIVLDQERVAAIMADTTEVSNVLHAVFADEADDAPEERPDADDGSDRFAGLDARHRGLTEELLRQPSWTPQDFEKLARQFRLMPAGALETINEWAFERYDAGLIDDAGNLSVNREILDAPAA